MQKILQKVLYFWYKITLIVLLRQQKTKRYPLKNKVKQKTIKVMAEVMETHKEYASNAKGNAALTTGRL